MNDSSTQQKGFSKFFFIALFLGGIGIHRFMTGKLGTAVLFMFTGGGFLIWWILDLMKIYKGEFK